MSPGGLRSLMYLDLESAWLRQSASEIGRDVMFHITTF